MSAYHEFVSSRQTWPDPTSLLTAIRNATDATAGISFTDAQHYSVKKATEFSNADLTACQAAIDGVAAATPRLAAQADIDRWPIEMRALLLTLLDQINVLRNASGLSTITPAQALNAVRTKAGTL